ncbi:MAG: tyrosine-protein phosphatase [Clostridia bacterium]|nr:tyrosine-protein phosphatase [Clostridia bacterium]
MIKSKLLKRCCAFALCLCCLVATTACDALLAGTDGSQTSDEEQVLELTVSQFTTPVSLLHNEVISYLQADDDVLVTEFLPGGNYRHDQGKPLTVSYELDNSFDVEEAKIELAQDKDFAKIEQTCNFPFLSEKVDVYNLQPGAKYYYRVSVTMQDGTKMQGEGEVETQDSLSFVYLDGGSNVRDIGGWKTESGKTVKKGILYRGGEIDGGKNKNHPDFCLTEKGIQQLRSLGIKTDFDLRSESVKVSKYSILGEDVTRTFYNAAQYESILAAANAEKTRRIFSDLAKPEAYPVYLHCTHGVDRAGSTILILEGLLGLSKADLVRDYELSAFYYNYAHVNRNVNNGGNILSLIDGLDAYEGESFADKVASFLLSIGVTQEEIDSIRTIFLD